MTDQRSEFSDSPSEAARLVRRIASAGVDSDHYGVKAAIRRVARRLGWSPSRTRSVWYGAARRISAAEMDQLRVVARSGSEEAKSRDELQELRARIARLERIVERTAPSSSRRKGIDLGRFARRMPG